MSKIGLCLGLILCISSNSYAYDNTKLVGVGGVGNNQQHFKRVTLESGDGGYCDTNFLNKALTDYGYRKVIHEHTEVKNLCPPYNPSRPFICSAAQISTYDLHDRYENVTSTQSGYLATETLVAFNLLKPSLYCDVSHYDYSGYRDIVTEAIRLDGQNTASITFEEFSPYLNTVDNSGGEIISNISYQVVEGGAADLSVKLEYFSNAGSWVDLQPVSTQLPLIRGQVDSITGFSSFGGSALPTGTKKIDHEYRKLINKWKLPYPAIVRISTNIKNNSVMDVYEQSIDIEECVLDIFSTAPNCL